MTDSRALFDTIRRIKGSPLSQADVDSVNDALAAASVIVAQQGMKTSQKGIALIQGFETCELVAYHDPGPTGLPITNGWGATVDDNGKPISFGAIWTKQKADTLFARDLVATENGVNHLLDGALTSQSQFDALVSFAYNVGLDLNHNGVAEGLGDSTLLRLHKAGDYVGAANQFPLWNKSKGKVLAGLTKRRAAEKAMYEGRS